MKPQITVRKLIELLQALPEESEDFEILCSPEGDWGGPLAPVGIEVQGDSVVLVGP